MSACKDGKLYYHGTDYDTEFDPIPHSKLVFGPDVYTMHPASLHMINDFDMVIQKLKLPENAKQLHFGTGVNIRLAISSSRVSSDLTLAEYTSKSRRILTEWLKGEDTGFSWAHLFDYIGQKEGRTAEEVEKRTRASIKEIVACDLVQKDIFGVARLPQFDLVMTQFGFEGACRDIPEYNEAMMKVSSFVKPGGYIVYIVVLGETYFTIAGKTFSALFLTRKTVDDALALAGFEAAEWYEHDLWDKRLSGASHDAKAFATLSAQKKK